MISKGVLSPAKIKDEKNKKKSGRSVHQNWRKRNKREKTKGRTIMYGVCFIVGVEYLYFLNVILGFHC